MDSMKKLMKQAQKMQAQMADLQAKLEEDTMEGTSGGGMVTAVVNGRHELISLKIKPAAVDPEDVEMLEDLVQTAINAANRRVAEHLQTEMSKVTGGMGLPGF
jgi:DNA-binding YbaB/EbfC family protein